MVNGEAPRTPGNPMRILTRSDVAKLLDMESCIAAVEAGFHALADPHRAQAAIMGLHVTGGGFHAKAATLLDAEAGASWFAIKLNANFPGNPRDHGLPTIQGLVALFDARCGIPVAVMDSMELTILRTAAATAVAARYLAADNGTELAIIGCGAQAHAQLAALCTVRPITRVTVFDSDPDVAARFAQHVREVRGLDCTASPTLSDATLHARIIVTCTPSRAPFLFREYVRSGAFIAAVGTDNEDKSEIDPSLMAECVVVVDSLEQCARIGDLHNAIAAGAMSRADVRATLSDVVQQPARGRASSEEIVLFDSTGVAIEDVAAAVVVYERAVRAGVGMGVAING